MFLLRPAAILVASIIIAATIWLAGAELKKEDMVRAPACNSSKPLSLECLNANAQELGLDIGKFSACLENEDKKALIDAEIAYGNELGLTATPSLYVGKGGESFLGFNLGGVYDLKDVYILLDYLQNHSAEEGHRYWLNLMKQKLAEFETEVRQYFASSQGGSLTGEALEKEVAAIMREEESTLESVVVLMELKSTNGIVVGDAEIALMEFTDYECPYCRDFAANYIQPLKTDYVDQGKARLIYMDYPITSLHPNAFKAAEAARCAEDQGKFQEYREKLFSL